MTGLLLSAALAWAVDVPLQAMPLFQRQTYIASVSGPMHWFQLDYHQVERSGCRVGIPVDGGEPLLSCYFPASRGAHARPAERSMRPAWRAAARAVRRQPGKQRDLRVRYQGTYSLVSLGDITPVPAGEHPTLDRAFDNGHAFVAVTDGGLERVVPSGMVVGGGIGLAPRWHEPPHFVRTEIDSQLPGRSLLRRLWAPGPPDPVVIQAADALLVDVGAALETWSAGERRGPATGGLDRVPDGMRQTLSTSVQVYARPARVGANPPAQEQGDALVTFVVPLDVALQGRVSWGRSIPDWDVQVEYSLDLPNGTAILRVLGAGGEAATATWEVTTRLLALPGPIYADAVLTSMVERSVPVVRQLAPLREDQLQVAGPPAFPIVDVYVSGPTPTVDEWSGAPDWTLSQPQ